MTGYGVPEDLDGTLPWSWAEERLAESRNFWLVTVNASGRPHSMPVWGVWMPDRERFGFSCAPTARKVRNIAANSQVAVTNDDATRVVSLEGRAEPLDERSLPVMAQGWARRHQVDLGLSGRRPQGQSGSSTSKPTGVPQVLRYETSWAGRRGATPHLPVG